MDLLLIDTPARIITPVRIGPGLTLPIIYRLLDCEQINACTIPGITAHAFYCDVNAMLKDPQPPSFVIAGHPWPIYGKALIFRVLAGGIESSATVTPEEIRKQVHWKLCAL